MPDSIHLIEYAAILPPACIRLSLLQHSSFINTPQAFRSIPGCHCVTMLVPVRDRPGHAYVMSLDATSGPLTISLARHQLCAQSMLQKA